MVLGRSKQNMGMATRESIQWGWKAGRYMTVRKGESLNTNEKCTAGMA